MGHDGGAGRSLRWSAPQGYRPIVWIQGVQKKNLWDRPPGGGGRSELNFRFSDLVWWLQRFAPERLMNSEPDIVRVTFNHRNLVTTEPRRKSGFLHTEFLKNASPRNYFSCPSILPLPIKGNDSQDKRPTPGEEDTLVAQGPFHNAQKVGNIGIYT